MCDGELPLTMDVTYLVWRGGWLWGCLFSRRVVGGMRDEGVRRLVMGWEGGDCVFDVEYAGLGVGGVSV